MPSSITTYTPFVDLTYNSLPIDFQSQLQLVATSYGITGPEIHFFAQQEGSRKKRKLNSHDSMVPYHDTHLPQGCLEKHHGTDVQGFHGHHQPRPDPNWPEDPSSALTSSSIPFVRRVAGFSRFLCPGCGLGLKQTDGMYPDLLTPISENSSDMSLTRLMLV